MDQATTMTVALRVSDVSGQKSVRAPSVPTSYTIGDLVRRLIAKMGLVHNDSLGRPLAYHARLEREGRHLHSSELVADALRDDDELVLSPDIDAG